ncbi:hypothetical protein [Noviherbaspirillum malthae]|uniref:hypothetical protein n=1 Tax=Noviherbaspirillum malthae TaxID=1260987 RepID=UPI00188E9768|nr:hypothetical protein [Noviherbaspirillum malthae]
MKVLNQAAKAAHSRRLANLKNTEAQRFSVFPVLESEFWAALMNSAKNRKTAQQILDEIAEIENEPCIENDRVFRLVETVKNQAKLTLLS